MKNLINKNSAFTLAEVLITLLIVAFIAWPFIQAAKRGTRHYANSLGTYSALKNLETAAYDMATQKGCTSADKTASYCTDTTGYIPTAGYSTATTRSFCYRLADEYFNIANFSAANCGNTPTISSGVLSGTPNFTTTNGMKFYGLAAPSSGVYTVYVDIDGPKRNSRTTESSNGKLDADIATFLVASNGDVIPDAGSVIANDVDYLSASVWYNDGTKDVYVLSGVPYRIAACATSTNPFSTIDSTYCSGTHGSYAAISSVTSPCNTKTCVFDYAKPQVLGN